MFIKRLLIKSKILESNIKEKELNNYMAEGIPLGMCFGVCIGVIVGIFLDNVPLCITFGIAIGMCLGLGIGSLIKKDNPKNK